MLQLHVLSLNLHARTCLSRLRQKLMPVCHGEDILYASFALLEICDLYALAHVYRVVDGIYIYLPWGETERISHADLALSAAQMLAVPTKCRL